jgi:hypothetical protein
MIGLTGIVWGFGMPSETGTVDKTQYLSKISGRICDRFGAPQRPAKGTRRR